MLAKLAPALAAIGAKPQTLRFDRGEIELDLSLGAGEPRGREDLVNRLRVPGLNIRDRADGRWGSGATRDGPRRPGGVEC